MEEGTLSRRAFLKFFFGVSVILSFAPFTLMPTYFFSKETKAPSTRKKIANVNEVPEGSTKVFFFPGEDSMDRSYLIHLSESLREMARVQGRDEFIVDGFVALNGICTHLRCPTYLPDDHIPGCPVENPEVMEIACPCHAAFFSMIDGKVLAGPAPRPLPMIRLEIEQETGDIYAVELIGKIGYGRV